MKADFQAGDTVKFNKTKDAVLFKVIERKGFNIGVVPTGTKNHAIQWIDVSFAIKG